MAKLSKMKTTKAAIQMGTRISTLHKATANQMTTRTTLATPAVMTPKGSSNLVSDFLDDIKKSIQLNGLQSNNYRFVDQRHQVHFQQN